jgi:putative glutamine amidotransferase
VSAAPRPVVGICAALERATFRSWSDVAANASPRTYSVAVGAAGGLPILLPPDEAGAREPDPVLDLVDALILTGGADINPSLYGAEPAGETQDTNLERDRFESAVAGRALERDLPVLAICRGMELLNVISGGTLEQHLPEAERHLHTPGLFTDHEVRLEEGSLAARAVGRERVSVRSHHHQGVGDLGDGMVATGWSEPDGVVEAIEIPDHRYALGVLWHPEEDVKSSVVGSLVEASRAVGAPA